MIRNSSFFPLVCSKSFPNLFAFCLCCNVKESNWEWQSSWWYDPPNKQGASKCSPFRSLLLCTKIEMSDERTPGDVSYQKLSISKLKSLLSARGVALPHVKDQPKEVVAATPQSNTRLFNRCSTTLGCTKPTSWRWGARKMMMTLCREVIKAIADRTVTKVINTL